MILHYKRMQFHPLAACSSKQRMELSYVASSKPTTIAVLENSVGVLIKGSAYTAQH
jgi:hypothetical protein